MLADNWEQRSPCVTPPRTCVCEPVANLCAFFMDVILHGTGHTDARSTIGKSGKRSWLVEGHVNKVELKRIGKSKRGRYIYTYNIYIEHSARCDLKAHYQYDNMICETNPITSPGIFPWLSVLVY